jgi:pimeloyl-ACP methyl ester carboxylesterase
VYEAQLPTAFVWARADGLGELIFGLFYSERPDEKMSLGFYDPSQITEHFVEQVEAALDRPGTTAAALAAVRGQRFEEVEERYRTVRQPVLLLWGQQDRVTHLSYGERLASELPNAKLLTYPRCGHFPMIEAAAASTRDLVAFLDTQPRPAQPTAKPEPEPEPDAGPRASAAPSQAPGASPPAQPEPEAKP